MQQKLFFCLCFAVLLSVSCSFNPPTVVLVKKQRIYSSSLQGRIAERLAVFVLLEDADGKNDYKELVLREDSTGLEWILARQDTVFLQETGFSKNSQWAGSNKFRYPRGFFPAGSYTVRAGDLSGNTVETAFALPEAPLITAAPFEFQLENRQWHIKVMDGGLFTQFSLILLSTDLQPLTVRKINPEISVPSSGSLDALPDMPADVRYVQCFGENTEETIGFISSPLLLQ